MKDETILVIVHLRLTLESPNTYSQARFSSRGFFHQYLPSSLEILEFRIRELERSLRWWGGGAGYESAGN